MIFFFLARKVLSPLHLPIVVINAVRFKVDILMRNLFPVGLPWWATAVRLSTLLSVVVVVVVVVLLLFFCLFDFFFFFFLFCFFVCLFLFFMRDASFMATFFNTGLAEPGYTLLLQTV